MSPRSSRYSGIFVLFASALLAIGVSGLFYYFKIKQNENYQNQLHFRELKDIGTSIDNGVEQIFQVATQKHSQLEKLNLTSQLIETTKTNLLNLNKFLSERRKQHRELLAINTRLQTLDLEIERENDQLADIAAIQNTAIKDIEKLIVEFKDSRGKLESSQLERAEKRQILEDVSYELSSLLEPRFSSLESFVETVSETQNELLEEECSEFEEEENSFCYVISEDFENLLGNNTYQEANNYKSFEDVYLLLKATFSEKLTNQLTHLDIARQSLNESLATLEQLDSKLSGSLLNPSTLNNATKEECEKESEGWGNRYCEELQTMLKDIVLTITAEGNLTSETQTEVANQLGELKSELLDDLHEEKQYLDFKSEVVKAIQKVLEELEKPISAKELEDFNKKLKEDYGTTHQIALDEQSHLTLLSDIDKGGNKKVSSDKKLGLVQYLSSNYRFELMVKELEEEMSNVRVKINRLDKDIDDQFIKLKASADSDDEDLEKVNQKIGSFLVKKNELNDEMQELIETERNRVNEFLMFPKLLEELKNNELDSVSRFGKTPISDLDIEYAELKKCLLNKLTFIDYSNNSLCRQQTNIIDVVANVIKDLEEEVAAIFEENGEQDEFEASFEREIALFGAGTALKRAKYESRVRDPKLPLFDNFDNSKLVIQPNTQNWKNEDWRVALSFGENWALTAPLKDFIGQSLDRYPLVLLADENGNRLVRAENAKLDSFQTGILFEHVDHLLKRLLKTQKPGKSGETKTVEVNNTNDINLKEDDGADNLTRESVGFSGFLDVEIAGIDYRLFVTPYENNDLILSKDGSTLKKGEKHSHFYLVGFRTKSSLNSEKLAVSNSIVLIAILVFIAVLALIPLLKIRYVSVSQAFSRSDRNTALFGLVVLVGVGFISFFDLRAYGDYKDHLKEQSRTIFSQIRQSFEDEFTFLQNAANYQLGLVQKAEHQLTPIKGKSNQYLFEKGELEGAEKGGIGITAESDNMHGYTLENLFVLDGNGYDAGYLVGTSLWLSEIVSPSSARPDLTERNYFKAAQKCDVWFASLDEESDCTKGFFIERIFNKKDARTTTQFSFPYIRSSADTEGNPADGKNYDVLSYGGRLRTFSDPLLPPNFGFLVFENESGRVLYHSDDSRSLVENIYIESDNSETLKAALRQGYVYKKPITTSLTYRGDDYLFTLGTLKNGVPWTLAIFYDKSEIRDINLAMVMIQVVLFVVVTYFMFLLFALIPKLIRRKISWSNWHKISRKKVLFFSIAPETMFSFVLTISVISYAGLSTDWLSSKVFSYHFDQYEKLIKVRLQDDLAVRRKSLNNYLNLVYFDNNAKVSYGKSMVEPNCYLGYPFVGIDGNLKNQCGLKNLGVTLSNEKHYQPLDLSWFTFFSFTWKNLSNTFDVVADFSIIQELIKVQSDSEVVIHNTAFELSQDYPIRFTQPDTEREESSRPRLTLVYLFSLLICVAVIFVLIRSWIAKRLLGINIPVHFRYGSSPIHNRHKVFNEWARLLTKRRFVQIIRPTAELTDNLHELQKKANAKIVNPVDIANLLEFSMSPEKLIDKYLKGEIGDLEVDKKTGTISESKENVQVVLYGFEAIALNRMFREKALELLEYLVNETRYQIIILCAVAPLYRLTQQAAYPGATVKEEFASGAEVVRWSQLMSKFTKLYWWTASQKSMLARPKKSMKVLEYEATGWPEVENLYEEFLNYHNLEKVKSGIKGKSISANWQPEQIIEFFGANAGAFYRYRWELCTKAERLLMYQIAKGLEPNPQNIEPLEHLMRRGFIFRDHGWHLINQSFQRFVLTAESPETIEEWMAEAKESAWRYLRIPLFALVIALVAIMVYSATDAIESALGVLTGILGLIPLAIRNISLFKGGSPPA